MALLRVEGLLRKICQEIKRGIRRERSQERKRERKRSFVLETWGNMIAGARI